MISYHDFSEVLHDVYDGVVAESHAKGTTPNTFQLIQEWAGEVFEEDAIDKIIAVFARNAQITALVTDSDPTVIVSFAMTGFHVGFELAAKSVRAEIKDVLNEAREIGDMSKRETFVVVELDKIMRGLPRENSQDAGAREG